MPGENFKGKAAAFSTLSPFENHANRLFEAGVLALVRLTRRTDPPAFRRKGAEDLVASRRWFDHPEPIIRDRDFLHYAYWSIVPRARLADRGREKEAPRQGSFLFVSGFTGDLADYLRGFTESLTEDMNNLWGSCAEWPGAELYEKCLAFIQRYERRTTAFWNAYGPHGIRDVRLALQARAELDRLALAARGEDAQAFFIDYERAVQALWGNGPIEAEEAP